VLFLIFTFFELIGDIVKNRTPLVTVGEYLFNLIPFIIYNVTPLSTLIAVLITFGTLNRTSELTAMKATGTSLYRVVAPVLLLATVLSVGLFAFDETYLPGANKRQEALLSVIKNKPAQTFFADRKWMSGQTTANGQPTRIFYYQYFDSDKNVFDNLTVFEFQPGSFNLTRRRMAGNGPSPAPPSPATSPSPYPPSLRSTSSPATSKKKTVNRRRCPTPSSPAISRT